MTPQKEKIGRKFGKFSIYPFKMVESLLLATLLIFSLVLVRGWATEPATSRSLFQSPPIGPTSTPTPGVFLVKQTPTPRPTPVLNLTFTNEPFYLSLANSGAYSVGSVANVSDEDILRFDGTGFSMFFDGSDVGVGSVNLNAFAIIDSDTILMSFDNPVAISGLGTVDDSDIVQFDATSLGDTTAGTFSWFFDGSDVGLSADSEDIDGIDFLPNGQLLISTIDSVSVTGVSGQDEDILILTPTSLGENTAGSWAMYFDGSDVGLADTSDEDVDGLTISTSGSIYLTTLGNFAVTGISGADEDVFVCIPDSIGSDTACTFSSALAFDGSVWGLSGNDVDAIDPLP